MHCKIFSYRSYPRLEASLQLTSIDMAYQNEIQTVMEEISSGRKTLAAVIHEVTALNDIPSLIRLAEKDKLIEQFCFHPELKEFWDSVLVSYGNMFNKKMMNDCSLLPQSGLHSFDLIRGKFFYHHAMSARKSAGFKFGFNEKEYLVQAMKYQSIQAALELNKENYSQMTTANETEEQEQHAKQAIKRSLSLVQCHKAVAYMMLAEAYARYGLLLTKLEGSQAGISKCYHAAVLACDKAASSVDKSKAEISNAGSSLGLAVSNSFGIESPDDAKIKIKELFSDYLDINDEPALTTPKFSS